MNKLTRRDFLRLSAMTSAGVLAAACSQATPQIIEKEVVKEVTKVVEKEVVKEVEKEVTKVVEKEVVKEVEKEVTPTPAPLNEAPQLRGLVSAGDLPPLAERLPTVPKVRADEIIEGIGQYGGTLYNASLGVGQFFDCWHVREMYMLHVDNACVNLFPEVADAYEFSADKKELTFKMRPGLKWSDGEPFTVDDIMFWWEEEQQNEEIQPAGPFGWWKVGGEWTEFIKVDDFTLTLKFPKPYGPALSLASNWQTLYHLFSQPAHYVKNWHIKFNPDANKLAEEEGYDDWTQAYSAHQNSFWNQSDTDIPEMGPWVADEFTTTYETFERNPYFFEVDPEGNQLPYIDQMYVYVMENKELMTAKAVSGELTTYNVFAQVRDMPLFKENEEKGDYQVREWKQSVAATNQYSFNINHKDPVLREIFSDIRFRRAMSLAINRQEINDIVYFGKGTIIQSTVFPDCSYYKEEWGNAYIEYDVDQANALLDEMGLEWDAAKQWRLRPDGQELSIVLQYNQEMVDTVMELMKEYWETVGMQVEVRAIERTLYNTRGQANELDVGVWTSDRMQEIRCYMPESTKFNPHSEMHYARDWETWFRSDGAEGEEPPQEWKDQYAIMERWYTAATDQDYHDLAQQVWQFFSDQLVCIGTIGYPPQPMIVKNGLMNVPQVAYRGDGANHLKTAWPQVWWWNL